MEWSRPRCCSQSQHPRLLLHKLQGLDFSPPQAVHGESSDPAIMYIICNAVTHSSVNPMDTTILV